MKDFIAKYGTPLTGLVLVIILSLFARNFIMPNNILTVLKQASFLVILSIGSTFALMTSELDLSFASLCSLIAVLVGAMLYHGVSWPLAALAGLGVGIGGGALNGFFCYHYQSTLSHHYFRHINDCHRHCLYGNGWRLLCWAI